MEKIKTKLTNFFRGIDCFKFPVNLRNDKQAEYDTVTGGCFSFTLIILLVSVFYKTLFNVVDKNIIITSSANIRQNDPQKLLISTKQFMFALGVIGIDLNSNSTRYFDIVLQQVYRDTNQTVTSKKIPLVKCTVNSWSHFGDDFTDTFNRFQLDTFVCPPQNYTLHFQGKYTSPEFAYLKMTFKGCSGSNCKSASEFDAYIAAKKAFYWDFFYTNTLINPEQQNPITNVFEDKLYSMVSNKMGIDRNIYISQFQMVTDNSIYPWVEQQVVNGIFIDKNAQQQWTYIPNDNNYGKIYLRKSDNLIEIQRSFRKMDDMLSYLGGLFGLISVGVGFIIKFYSQCSLQLSIGDVLFQYDQEQPIDQLEQSTELKSTKKQQLVSQFNFFSYLTYVVYLGLKMLGFQPKWKNSIMYDEVIEETRNQLDVNMLLQKMVFFDKAIHTLFDESQLKLLYLQEKFKIHQIKKQREMLNLAIQLLNIRESQISPMQLQPTLISPKLFMITDQENKNNNGNTYRDITNTRRISKNTKLFQSIVNQKQIPQDILKALQAIEIKIAGGDQISIRIFQGLQPQLLKGYKKKQEMKVKSRKKVKRKTKSLSEQSIQSMIL